MNVLSTNKSTNLGQLSGVTGGGNKIIGVRAVFRRLFNADFRKFIVFVSWELGWLDPQPIVSTAEVNCNWQLFLEEVSSFLGLI